MTTQAPRGHERLPHTADVRLHAWAPSRADCIAEAIAAMVGCFAVVPPGAPIEPVDLPMSASNDLDLLVGALDEVIFRLETEDQVPGAVTVAETPEGVRLHLEVTDVASAQQIGAIPKAVSLHDLSFAADQAAEQAAEKPEEAAGQAAGQS